MVDDTYYITPHEAALAVVATAMKKSRLPFYILFINSIMGAFLFSAGSMLYVMCEAGSAGLMPGAFIFVYLAQGAVYAIGLFYVIVCGMELFNSNILFFSVGVMRGAVTLMDLLISWLVSFWVNLAATIFVVYVICYCSGVFRQEIYVTGSVSIAHSKNHFSFPENLLKGIAGNFFVCLAVYLQIMVKPLHVKFLMIFLPIFTFVAMGFTHVVADMFLVPAGIFNDCGYGFGHYFWKIMLPGAIGNILGGSFFGIVIPWFLHLYVIENDMKKLKLPAYEERDEQPMLNMESRVVRVPTQTTVSSAASPLPQEFKPDDENDISRVATARSATSTGLNPTISRVVSGSTIHPRSFSKQIRSPRGVFPVADMGEPLQREKTIASSYAPVTNIEEEPPNTLEPLIDPGDNSSNSNENAPSLEEAGVSPLDDDDENSVEDGEVSAYSGNSASSRSMDDDKYIANDYDPEKDKVSSKLIRALSRTVTRSAPKDLETGEATNRDTTTSAAAANNTDEDGNDFGLTKVLTHAAVQLEHKLASGLEEKPSSSAPKTGSMANTKASYSSAPAATPSTRTNKLQNNKLFRQFTFGGGGNNTAEIRRRLSEAKITRKAAGMSNDIAGIHERTIDSDAHVDSARRSSSEARRSSKTASGNRKSSVSKSQKQEASDQTPGNTWRHVNFDYEYDGERPVSFISEHSEDEEDPAEKKKERKTGQK